MLTVKQADAALIKAFLEEHGASNVSFVEAGASSALIVMPKGYDPVKKPGPILYLPIKVTA